MPRQLVKGWANNQNCRARGLYIPTRWGFRNYMLPIHQTDPAKNRGSKGFILNLFHLSLFPILSHDPALLNQKNSHPGGKTCNLVQMESASACSERAITLNNCTKSQTWLFHPKQLCPQWDGRALLPALHWGPWCSGQGTSGRCRIQNCPAITQPSARKAEGHISEKCQWAGTAMDLCQPKKFSPWHGNPGKNTWKNIGIIQGAAPGIRYLDAPQGRDKLSPWSDCSANPKQTGKRKHFKLESDKWQRETLARFKPQTEIAKEILNK